MIYCHFYREYERTLAIMALAKSVGGFFVLKTVHFLVCDPLPVQRRRKRNGSSGHLNFFFFHGPFVLQLESLCNFNISIFNTEHTCSSWLLVFIALKSVRSRRGQRKMIYSFYDKSLCDLFAKGASPQIGNILFCMMHGPPLFLKSLTITYTSRCYSFHPYRVPKS